MLRCSPCRYAILHRPLPLHVPRRRRGHVVLTPFCQTAKEARVPSSIPEHPDAELPNSRSSSKWILMDVPKCFMDLSELGVEGCHLYARSSTILLCFRHFNFGLGSYIFHTFSYGRPVTKSQPTDDVQPRPTVGCQIASSIVLTLLNP